MPPHDPRTPRLFSNKLRIHTKKQNHLAQTQPYALFSQRQVHKQLGISLRKEAIGIIEANI